MNPWPWIWVGWAVYFIVFEGIALWRKGKGDTLSENVRGLFHTKTFWGRMVLIVVLGSLFGWLLVHFDAPGVVG